MLKITPESTRIHDMFMIALKASKRLKNDTFINSTRTIKLKAPPKFCPFSFDSSCDSTAKYRQIDGSCNNLESGIVGRSSTPYKRLLKPAYEDGINEPRKNGVNGSPLPNPRSISIALHEPSDIPTKISNLGVMFGQFIDHDFALTATTGSGSPFKCSCDQSSTSDCINIPTPDEDTLDSDQQCMGLTRSGASFSKFDCTLDAREQSNLLTHWLDLSQLYGSDSSTQSTLRSFSNGRLKTSTARDFSRDFLPTANSGTCVDESGDELCFQSGDVRTSQNLMLVSIHTIFLREHNRVARVLQRLNPSWSDENLYQEAKRIVNAEYQNVLYNEWLPILIGQNLYNSLGLAMESQRYFMGYNSSVNPHLSAEFATAAFRFGHSLVIYFLNI